MKKKLYVNVVKNVGVVGCASVVSSAGLGGNWELYSVAKHGYVNWSKKAIVEFDLIVCGVLESKCK